MANDWDTVSPQYPLQPGEPPLPPASSRPPRTGTGTGPDLPQEVCLKLHQPGVGIKVKYLVVCYIKACGGEDLPVQEIQPLQLFIWLELLWVLLSPLYSCLHHQCIRDRVSEDEIGPFGQHKI